MDHEHDLFPRFLDLSFQLRDQIWKEALPKPGIFPVQYESVNTVRADQQGDRKAVRLALGPSRHGPHDFDDQERVRTSESRLATCLESRAVVSRRFPGTLDERRSALSSEPVDRYGGLTCQPSEPLVSDGVDATELVILVRPAILIVQKGDRYDALKDLEMLKMLHISRKLRVLCRDFFMAWCFS